MRFYKKDSTPKRHSQPDPPPSYESPKRSPTPEDPEKQLSVPEEDTMGTALPQIPSTAITIDPAVERRVLRKLDLRVPTLLGFLCRLRCWCFWAEFISNDTDRSSGYRRSIQHRVRLAPVPRCTPGVPTDTSPEMRKSPEWKRT